MALSKEDQAFYEKKLGLNTFGYLFGATVLIGGIMWPLLLYIQDSSSGLASQWTLSVAFDWSMIGLMVGSIVGIFMYLFFKFLLSMGWLPSRR